MLSHSVSKTYDGSEDVDDLHVCSLDLVLTEQNLKTTMMVIVWKNKFENAQSAQEYSHNSSLTVIL